MGITGFIAIFILIIFFGLVSAVISGIKQREWKKVIYSILGFVLFVGVGYLGLTFFITSM